MVVLILKMNTLICFVVTLILIYGTVAAEDIKENVHTDNATIPNDNVKARSSEVTTELTKVENNGNQPDVRSEKLLINAKDDAKSTLSPLKTDEEDNTESLSDFEDLEYDRNANNDEDDFVDEDRFATEPNKDQISKKNKEVDKKADKEVDKDKVSNKMDTSTSALVPIIEASVRAGEVLKSETDDTNRSASFSNENSEASEESNLARRMFNSGLLLNQENKFVPDYAHFRTASKPLNIFGHNFGRILSQPYQTTPYTPVKNEFYAPFQSFPVQNTNPYNYMNKSPKTYEYPNSYETSNSYPYTGHVKKDSMPTMPYNVYGSSGQDYYRRIIPGLLHGYNNAYSHTNNFGSQAFGHQRFV